MDKKTQIQIAHEIKPYVPQALSALHTHKHKHKHRETHLKQKTSKQTNNIIIAL